MWRETHVPSVEASLGFENGSAQIAAIRLSGDVNAKVDESTIEELLVKIKEEYKALGPLLDLEVVSEAQGSRTKRRLTAGSRAVEHDRRQRGLSTAPLWRDAFARS